MMASTESSATLSFAAVPCLTTTFSKSAALDHKDATVLQILLKVLKNSGPGDERAGAFLSNMTFG